MKNKIKIFEVDSEDYIFLTDKQHSEAVDADLIWMDGQRWFYGNCESMTDFLTSHNIVPQKQNAETWNDKSYSNDITLMSVVQIHEDNIPEDIIDHLDGLEITDQFFSEKFSNSKMYLINDVLRQTEKSNNTNETTKLRIKNLYEQICSSTFLMIDFNK